MRKFVIGDIHGAFKALNQCLQRCSFDPENDRLICLGDVTDGWPETKECIDLLISIPDLILLKGNHDALAIEWAKSGYPPMGWEEQGGYATIESYDGKMVKEHLEFLESARLNYLFDNKLFVHAGILLNTALEDQDEHIFLWDRSLFQNAFPHRNEEKPPRLTQYDSIYIGHSPIHRYGYDHPIQSCEVWMMDTGAGWDGVLSILDIDTREYWTSDAVNLIYPGHKGRFL